MNELPKTDMTTFMSDLAAKSMTALPEAPGDYRKDGLLYCGKCRTVKEAVIEFAGKPMKVRIPCDCAKAEQKKRDEAVWWKDVNAKREKWIKGYTEMTLKNDTGINPNIPFAKRYIDKWDDLKASNVSFVLCGPVGCGKTYAAAAIANKLIDQGTSVLMRTTSHMIDIDMDFENQEVFLDKLAKFELVILDDFGAERGTEFATQRMFDIIDTRIKAGKPMLITTNISAETLEHPTTLAEERIYSRILGACTLLRCKGDDLRKGEAEAKKKLAAEIWR